MGRGQVMDYLSHTGMDALKGADILSTAPEKYSSSIEYGNNSVAQYMRNIAQTHIAGFGTRFLYTTAPYNSFDTHAGQMVGHSALWAEVSAAVRDFQADLTESNSSDNMTLLVFSEFGRRVHDNGSALTMGRAGSHSSSVTTSRAAFTVNTRRWKRTSCLKATSTTTMTSEAYTPLCWKSG
ncbi:MAG: hypothetical protein CM1200mP27_11120 [Chloroflexota bacterium]|nr:MAG: hypothetical protein CM1200mP27_11120 [Chloroflexota bacterium]